MFGQHESIDQFRHHVVWPLLRLFHDLIERQGHASSVQKVELVSTSPFTWVAVSVGSLEVDDGQPGVVLERFQDFLTEQVFAMPEGGDGVS